MIYLGGKRSSIFTSFTLVWYLQLFLTESLKAYRLLGACNYFVSGHVQNVYYREIEKIASWQADKENFII